MSGQIEELTLLAASEGGKPYKDSKVEVIRAIDGVHLCAETLRYATASRSLGSRVPGVRACRLVAPAVPDPGRAIGSRPLIGPRIRPEERVATTSGSLDGPLTQLYFGTAD